MDQKRLFNLIKEAQLILVKNPQNEAHEITHHYRTWLNAKLISEHISEEFDISILELICWWHDVKVSEVESGKRICETTANYLSSKFNSKISEII